MTNTEYLKSMSREDFARLGADEIVYVKPVEQNGEVAFALHQGDGQPVALTSTREAAIAAAGDYDVELVSVH